MGSVSFRASVPRAMTGASSPRASFSFELKGLSHWGNLEVHEMSLQVGIIPAADSGRDSVPNRCHVTAGPP